MMVVFIWKNTKKSLFNICVNSIKNEIIALNVYKCFGVICEDKISSNLCLDNNGFVDGFCLIKIDNDSINVDDNGKNDKNNEMRF